MEMIDHITTSPEVVKEQAKRLMTAVQFCLFLDVSSSIQVIVAFFGIVSNIINIKTFKAMGAFTDGVNLAFLCLAVSDFILCCWTLLAAVFSGFFVSHEARVFSQLGISTSGSNQIYTGFVSPMDPLLLGMMGLNMIQVFNITTISITVYLAVARCLCVLRPLKFRNSISVRKTSIFVTLSFFLSLTSRLPLLAHTDFVMMFDTRLNYSRPTVSFKPNRILIKDMTWLAVDMTCCVGSQIILLICIYIMLRGLRAAVKFRLKNARANEHKPGQGKDASDSGMRKSNTKENRIAKQMLLVSTIFLVCNTPKLLSYVTTNVVPEFDYAGLYRYTYLSSLMLQVVFDTLNSSLNIFVYYNYNSKFRKTFLGVKESIETR